MRGFEGLYKEGGRTHWCIYKMIFSAPEDVPSDIEGSPASKNPVAGPSSEALQLSHAAIACEPNKIEEQRQEHKDLL